MMLASFLLMLAAAPPPAADRAGNRIEPLMAQRQVAPSAGAEPLPATVCNGARFWCATVRRDGAEGPWTLLVYSAGLGGAPRRLTLPQAAEDETELAVWPFLVREADGALLVGIKWYRRTMYSGGGAGAERLQLLRLAGAAAPVAVLEAPSEGSSMVRACFSQEDMRSRRRACHDEYEFSGTLTLDPATTAGRPHFILTTMARTYPGRLAREEDSAERPPLRRRDLVWWRDPDCSYTRRFAPDAAGLYAPDAPLPACSDYLDI
ncbi:MAG TPA: hypothetical protein VLK25_08870 [Allosphingosinicella sp.]|nr:hypothetical protein [Allosphingosinicella sp.]